MERVCGRLSRILFAVLVAAAPAVGEAAADEGTRFVVELEAGAFWQARNDVQIPNTDSGTRFSLEDLTGQGPRSSGRLYLTWNIDRRHSLRGLLAPLSFTESGLLDRPVAFAGESYRLGVPTVATYRFNSWRLSYRYRLREGDRWQLWIGGTAKIRDAKIELRQGRTTSRDDDLGFVPLLHFGAAYSVADRWRLLVDADALGGGPGRAIDLAVKLRYDVSPRWAATLGYRTLEGGADTDDVYSFAWFNWVAASVIVEF